MTTALLAGLFEMMTGCASGPAGSAGRSARPAAIDDMDIAQIVRGKTTRSEVEARLGKPHRVMTDAEGREIYDYRIQGRKWEPGEFESTRGYGLSGFVQQPVNVADWNSGRWTHESKRLRVALDSEGTVDAVEVVD